MRRKYMVSIAILLILLIGIFAYKLEFFNIPKLDKKEIDSSILIEERINNAKKDDNSNNKVELKKKQSIEETKTIETTIEKNVNIETKVTEEEIPNNKPSLETDNKTTSTKQDEPKKEESIQKEPQKEETSHNPIKTEPVIKSIEEQLEALINKNFDNAVNNLEINKYEYPYQIDNSLKNKIETINQSKLDYSKNRFYIINHQKLLNINSNETYIYDKYTKHVIKVDSLSQRNTGTWFWCSNKNHEVLNDLSKQNDFFNKLEKYNITEIYMSYHHKQLNNENIKRFIKNAYQRNIRVYLCLGEIDFLNPDSYKTSIYEVFDYVDSYNKSVNYNERFAGVSYDAEVWNNKEYNWKNNINTRNQHVAYIKEAKRYADSKNLSVIFTLSFWLVQYNTSTGNMYDEITKILDRTSLMVYRDSYEKIKKLVVEKQENASDSLMNIASKNNCLIDIAVETMYSDEGNQVSFYEEEKSNPGYLLNTLKQVDNLLNKYDNHMFSIHHAMSLINDFNGGLK